MTLKGIMHYICYALLIGIPIFTIWGYYRAKALKKKEETISLKRECVIWLFSFYIICLYMITVFRFELSLDKMITRPNGLNTINLVPFIELQKLWEYGYWWSFTYNIIGNIIWFLPLGFLLPSIQKKWGILRVVITGFVVSFSIEVLQFVCVTGISDIDDIIFNTMGTLGGWILYKVFYWGYKRYVRD